jgi:hypothetical protein
MKQNTTADVDEAEIESTFTDATGDEHDYEWLHDYEGEFGVSISYLIDEEARTLETLTRYWEAGLEVHRTTEEWELTDDGFSVQHGDGQRIRQWCIDHGSADPVVAIETAIKRAADY